MPRSSKLTVLILWELHNECDVTLTDQFNFQTLLFDTNSITLSDQRKHVQITNVLLTQTQFTIEANITASYETVDDFQILMSHDIVQM